MQQHYTGSTRKNTENFDFLLIRKINPTREVCNHFGRDGNSDSSCEKRRIFHSGFVGSAGLVGGAFNFGVRSSVSATDCSVPKLSFSDATPSGYMDCLNSTESSATYLSTPRLRTTHDIGPSSHPRAKHRPGDGGVSLRVHLFFASAEGSLRMAVYHATEDDYRCKLYLIRKRYLQVIIF